MAAVRPNVPTSADGEPLAVSIQDLYATFPYDRVADGVVGLTLRPEVMVALVLAYVASKPILSTFAQRTGFDGRKSRAFFVFVALHNLGLAAFSAVVMVNSWTVVLEHLSQKGLHATYCDVDGSLWSGGLGAWTVIFYLSKFYEFVDTWVLILKGKKASFLQTYHHIGIVLTMWGAVVAHAAWILIAVLLNSFIHTLMYTYFFAKTLYPGWEIKAAKYLTTAQIVQFFTGIAYTIPLLFLGTSCQSPTAIASVIISQLYAMGLIVLFFNFASKKYKKVC